MGGEWWVSRVGVRCSRRKVGVRWGGWGLGGGMM